VPFCKALIEVCCWKNAALQNGYIADLADASDLLPSSALVGRARHEAVLTACLTRAYDVGG
jgi:hypothetical protein